MVSTIIRVGISYTIVMHLGGYERCVVVIALPYCLFAYTLFKLLECVHTLKNKLLF